MLWETVRLALLAITRNALRSFLTVLGVVIGVAAVIAMVTIGQGSSEQVTSDVESLGSDVLMLRPGGGFGGPGASEEAANFTLRDAEALGGLSVLSAVAPVVSSMETVVYGNANASTTVTGTTSDYLDVGNWTVLRGRGFTEAEESAGAAVCILGESLRQELFGNADPTGETIRIDTVSCLVIGYLEAKGAGMMGQDQDDLILMPIRAVQRRLVGAADVASFQLALTPGVSADRGTREIEALMRERRRISVDEADDFRVMDMAQIASMLTSVNAVLTGLLSAVAAVKRTMSPKS